MSEPRDETVPSQTNYRTEFASSSLGTEEELHGARVRMKTDAGQLIGVVRRPGLLNPVLVEITKDMQESVDEVIGRGRYTIELRTTPCEITAEDDWADRTKALNAVILSIGGRKDEPLTKDDYYGYETVILNADHQIYAPEGIKAADRQATVGIQAAEIGRTVTPSERSAGKLHEHLTLPWYHDTFVDDPQVSSLSERERVGYALVLSAVLQLATIWHRRNANSVNHVNAKDAWIVRPRTPPIQILDTFSSDDAITTARTAIQDRDLPDWIDINEGPPPQKWSDARRHILAGEPMGGHHPPAATINDEAATLFEYRQAPPGKYEHAFWHPGNWQPWNYPGYA